MNPSPQRHREGRHADVTGVIIDAAREVHRELGPGLLESAYKEALSRELEARGTPFMRQVPLPVRYKGLTLDGSYRIDLIVSGVVVVELKSVDSILPIHEAQLLTYMKLSGRSVGLLLNFNVAVLKEGIRRRVFQGFLCVSAVRVV